MQAFRSAFDTGRMIHDRLFGNLQTHDSFDVLELIPKNLGPSLLSTDSETSVGWGIEIFEGPSWAFTCLQLVPAVVALMTLKLLYTLPPKVARKSRESAIPDQIHVPKPATDVFLIAMGISLLILVLVKGSRMLESGRRST